MIIGLTGLHCSGKSFISNILVKILNFKYINKRDFIKNYYIINIIERKGDFLENRFIEWYREKYKTLGGYKFMQEVFKNFDFSINIIIDAIHNVEEWEFFMNFSNKSILIYVVTPRNVRNNRDKNKVLLDKNRISSWHSLYSITSYSNCLLSFVEWSFNGALDKIDLENDVYKFKKTIIEN